MTESVSGEEFAELAARWPATVEEQYLTLVREPDLPVDWLETTVECYSTEAHYYSLALYGDLEPMKERVNEYAALRMARASCRAALDCGVGDGTRLEKICSITDRHGAPRPRMFGIELSEQMVGLAEQRGVTVVRADMRNGIPDFGTDLDFILFLSGGFGYLMDPTDGRDLRLRLLNAAYDRLSSRGEMILEFLTRDPHPAEDGADIFYFSRVPWLLDPNRPSTSRLRGPETWQYVKTFTMLEIESLIEASRFDLARSSMRYIVRGSENEGRIGEFVEDFEITTDEAYRILVSVTK
jgi:hypothetical protein